MIEDPGKVMLDKAKESLKEKVNEAVWENFTKAREFTKNEDTFNVHGSNIKAYNNELSISFRNKLKERRKLLKKKILEYPTDDAGNLECFVNVYGDFVMYNCDEEFFYVWNGRFWMKDTEMMVPLWCNTILKARRDYTLKRLEENPEANNYKELMKYAKRCCNQNCVKGLIEGLKSNLSCNSAIFDTNPHLLNVLNGTINLKTGELKEHNRKNLITKIIPVVYDEEARSKTFEKFLEDTFQDKELIRYVHRLFGYCITGEANEQVAHFFIGNGANGKSTLLSAIRYVMNDYAAVVPAKVLTGIERAGGTSSEISKLPHKRLVCCSELNCTDILNEGKIKIMSGGETISARELFKSSFTYDPEFKFIIDTNYLPIITGTDHGIWRRVVVVPFNHTVPKNKINKNLLNELKMDSKAILRWLVKGAKKYYEEGLGECDAIKEETKKYRKSQDTLSAFIDSCIEKVSGAEVRARALYEAYTAYCSENLLNAMSETKFGKDFAARGYEKGKDKISRKYVDIKLKIAG